jgi:4-hydroxy-tetrahydrodipicolinate synthase
VATEIIATTGLAYYSGDDPVNLPLLSIGAVGFVSVIGHVVADRLRVLVDAYEAGDVARARTVHAATLPVIRAMGRAGGVIFSKAALRLRGVDVGDPRLPLPPATAEQIAAIADDLAEAGVPLARALDVGGGVVGGGTPGLLGAPADRGVGVGPGATAS